MGSNNFVISNLCTLCSWTHTGWKSFWLKNIWLGMNIKFMIFSYTTILLNFRQLYYSIIKPNFVVFILNITYFYDRYVYLTYFLQDAPSISLVNIVLCIKPLKIEFGINTKFLFSFSHICGKAKRCTTTWYKSRFKSVDLDNKMPLR